MEIEFLKRISLVMGEQQIIKIKGMIEDMANSKVLNKNFMDHIKKRKSSKDFSKFSKINLELTLITKAKWPSEVLDLEVCEAPSDLALISDKFREYYVNSLSGMSKKIEWLLGEGYVEVSANFSGKKYTLMVSVAQYGVIQALDQAASKSMTVGELKAIVKFDKSKFLLNQNLR